MLKILAAKNTHQLIPSQLALLSQDMPDAATAKAAKYHRWQDAQAYLWGRYLLVEGLQYFGFDKKLLHDIQYTAYNKPYLPIPLQFNIAHSGDYILCAFSETEIGIDIESVQPVAIDDFTSCFTAYELTTIKNSSDVYQEFFRHWTIKEAVIKADGRGLSIPLETIQVADEMLVDKHKWFIHQLDIAPEYIAHLATNNPLISPIEIEWMSLPTNKKK